MNNMFLNERKFEKIQHKDSQYIVKSSFSKKIKRFKTLDDAKFYYEKEPMNTIELLNEYSRVILKECLEKFIKFNDFPVTKKVDIQLFYRNKVDRWLKKNYKMVCDTLNE